jgi:predicted DNA-binding transcriptional regulator AlpA
MDRLLTAEEVAERLGMRTDWVWAQARAGRIPWTTAISARRT